VFLRLASHEDDLSKLTRYETTLERSLQRALRALERRQILRGEGAFAPVREMTLMTSPNAVEGTATCGLKAAERGDKVTARQF
jgi:hypothetical protein